MRNSSWHLLLLWLSACGQAEEIVLPQKPDRVIFADVRSSLIRLGCSANGGGCHAVLVGDFKLGTPDSSPGDTADELQLIKGIVDLESPENSLILRVALRGDPLALGHPICFDTETSCAYRRVIAWLSYDGEGDETPDEVCKAADVIENACFTL
jgi:hypothetical protein